MDAGRPSCSFLVDNIGHLAHLHARDTTLVLVCRAPYERLRAYRERMGWTVPWYSSPAATSTSTATSRSTRTAARTSTTTRPPSRHRRRPRTCAFLRAGDDVVHTYSSHARGGDAELGTTPGWT
jgi:predicted dithiol-disulfide oxidoreductase (DUF899 family)